MQGDYMLIKTVGDLKKYLEMYNEDIEVFICTGDDYGFADETCIRELILSVFPNTDNNIESGEPFLIIKG
jgi:hypothetical protein